MSAPVTVTTADRDAVTAFHNAQLERIFMGDRTLGENRDAIEQAFARHRQQAEAASKAREDALVEAIIERVESYVFQPERDERDNARNAICRIIAQDIRLLASAKASSDGGEG